VRARNDDDDDDDDDDGGGFYDLRDYKRAYKREYKPVGDTPRLAL